MPAVHSVPNWVGTELGKSWEQLITMEVPRRRQGIVSGSLGSISLSEELDS